MDGKHTELLLRTMPQFVFDASQCHEMQDYSNWRFENIHCEQDGRISFKRTDFSYSNFKDCIFERSLFDRADFINVYFENTNFVESDFGNALFENCIFKEVIFKRNAYEHAHFRGCHFEECHFEDEKWCIEFDDSNFCGCTLTRISNIRSIISGLTFDNVIFRSVDIAECHTEDLVFKRCDCTDLTVDRERWLTFYYVESKIEGLKLKYHGKLTSVDEDQRDVKALMRTNRYFECLNLMVIWRMSSMTSSGMGSYPQTDSSFKILAKDCIQASLQQPVTLRRWNMVHIFKLLEIFYGHPAIALEEYIATVKYLVDIPWVELGADEHEIEEFLGYFGRAQALLERVQLFDFDDRMMYTINPASVCLLTIKTQIECKNEFLAQLEDIFRIINTDKTNNAYKQPYFVELHAEQGCWVVTVGSFLLLAAFLCRLITTFGAPIFNLITTCNIKATIASRTKELIRSGQLDEVLKDSLNQSLCKSITLPSCQSHDNEKSTVAELSKEVSKLQISEMVLDALSTVMNG